MECLKIYSWGFFPPKKCFVCCTRKTSSFLTHAQLNKSFLPFPCSLRLRWAWIWSLSFFRASASYLRYCQSFWSLRWSNFWKNRERYVNFLHFCPNCAYFFIPVIFSAEDRWHAFQGLGGWINLLGNSALLQESREREPWWSTRSTFCFLIIFSVPKVNALFTIFRRG